jgi:hypothetical protein
MLPLEVASVFLSFLILHKSESLPLDDSLALELEGDLESPDFRDSSCYPSPTQSLNFPDATSSPTQASQSWWCPAQREFAWLGFSYDVSYSLSTVNSLLSIFFLL